VISDKTATAIIIAVTIMWTINILAGMFQINDYDPDPVINGIFITIVGAALTARYRAGGGGDK
jgi:hypothetical protein